MALTDIVIKLVACLQAKVSFSSWQGALMQIPGVSTNVAQAIEEQYPGMFSLLCRYQMLNRQEGERLLQDIMRRIPIGKSGPTSPGRIVSHSLSGQPNILHPMGT